MNEKNFVSLQSETKRIHHETESTDCLRPAGAGGGVQAQYGADYYHRTGDTVYTYSDIAFYNWWDFEQMLLRRECITVGAWMANPINH